MRERIRRARVLFSELGYEVLEGEGDESSYTAGFQEESGFQGGFYIDEDSKFIELAFTFTFSHTLGEFIRSRMEEMLRICYEYGCYVNLQTYKKEISFTIFSKVYYAGLNYYALKEILRDFRGAVETLRELIEIKTERKKGDIHGDS
jgi:hypothetical protein